MDGRKTIAREPTVDEASPEKNSDDEIVFEDLPVDAYRVAAKTELQRRKDAVSDALEAGKKAYAEVVQKTLPNITEVEIVHASELDRLKPQQKKAASMGSQHGDVNLEFLKAVLPVLHELSKDHMTPRPVGPDASTVEFRESIAEARRVLQERGHKP